jgi:hypothetical protein
VSILQKGLSQNKANVNEEIAHILRQACKCSFPLTRILLLSALWLHNDRLIHLRVLATVKYQKRNWHKLNFASHKTSTATEIAAIKLSILTYLYFLMTSQFTWNVVTCFTEYLEQLLLDVKTTAICEAALHACTHFENVQKDLWNRVSEIKQHKCFAVSSQKSRGIGLASFCFDYEHLLKSVSYLMMIHNVFGHLEIRSN